MAKRGKSLFIVATQYDNLGDLIINKCLIDELAKHTELFLDLKDGNESFKQPLLESKDVHSLYKEYGFTLRNVSFLKYLISYRREFSYLFKSPGPIVYKIKPSFKKILRNKVLDIIYGLFSRQGEMYIIGSEVSLESETLEKKLKGLQKVKNILVRSKANVKYLHSLNLYHTEYIPDMAFLLRDKINPNVKKEVIGISFRDLNDPKEDRSIKSAILTLVDFYTKRGNKVIFFYQVERDRDYTYNFYNDFVHYTNVSFRDQCLNFDQIDIYEDFRIVISNRLHVLLLGLIHNSIPIPVLNDNFKTRKITGILDSIGYETDNYNLLTDSKLNETETKYDVLVDKVNEINEVQLKICEDKIANIFK